MEEDTQAELYEEPVKVEEQGSNAALNNDAADPTLTRPRSLKTMAGKCPASQRRFELLQAFKDALDHQSEVHHERHGSLCACPSMVARAFCAHGPMGGVLMKSILMPSSMRGLFVFLDCLGALLCATLFFSSTGGAPEKENPPICDVELDFWGSISYCTMVALMSSLLAGAHCIRGISSGVHTWAAPNGTRN
jgi:hypothetical protein